MLRTTVNPTSPTTATAIASGPGPGLAMLHDEVGDDPVALAVRERIRGRAEAELRRVLVAEDNPGMRRLICRALRRGGHAVVEAANGFELMHWVDLMTGWRSAGPFVDLVVTDHRMPMFSGMECLEQLWLCGNATPVIVITAFGDEQLHAAAIEHGARAVFDKPLDLDALCDAVDDCLH